MTLETICQDFRVLLAANTTSASITAPIATITEPVTSTTVAVIDMRETSRNQVLLGFFGAGSSNNAGTVMIYRWRRIAHASEKDRYLWIPTPLLGLDVTLGTAAGIAAYPITNSQLFADTLGATTNKDHTDAFEVISNANNEIALVKLDTFGCRKVEVRFAIGTATSLNVFASEF
jgi:hypothetical protein